MYVRRYAREHAESVDTMRGIIGASVFAALFWLPLIVLLTWWVG